MPYHFEFDSANRILRGRFEGQVTDESLKEYYEVLKKYVVLTDPHAGITDFSEVTSFEVSPQTIRELASLEPAMPDPTRPRFVVAVSPPIFGMARLFQMEGEDTRPNLHVFHTLGEAYAFLGVEKTKFEPIQAE